jgi:tetraacyldisaccharide 4'-kinase
VIDFRKLFTSRNPALWQVLLRCVLRLGCGPYWLAVAAKNFAYDRGIKATFVSPLPVISVGNLSVGGTGKSPTVAWIANWLRARNIRVAILSRGYGQLDSGQNDEALELELQLPDVPHLQHWDRVASATLAEEELDMQVLVLDDGFQHRRIARNLEIVLLDATDPPSARHVLPGGLLREPMGALQRADLIFLTRTDQAETRDLHKLIHQIQRKNPHAKIAHARHCPSRILQFPNDRLPVGILRGKQVLAFCAIGNPNSFFGSLHSLGADVVDARTWPDHHAFTAEDVAELVAWTAAFPNAQAIVCTVKDWVKIQLRELGGLDFLALGIELQITEGACDVEDALQCVVAGLAASQS